MALFVTKDSDRMQVLNYTNFKLLFTLLCLLNLSYIHLNELGS